MHHLLNNELIIDLLISPDAQSKYTEVCNRAVVDFKAFFDQEPEKKPWYRDQENAPQVRYQINIAAHSDLEIFAILDKIRELYTY